MYLPFSTGNVIRGNRIFGNAGLGHRRHASRGRRIVHANDAGDVDLARTTCRTSRSSVGHPQRDDARPGIPTFEGVDGYDLDFYANPPARASRENSSRARRTSARRRSPRTAPATRLRRHAAGRGRATGPGSGDGHRPGGQHVRVLAAAHLHDRSRHRGRRTGGRLTIRARTSRPARLTIGGVPRRTSRQRPLLQITATSPALPAGTVNDIVVTTPDGTTGTLVKGWVSDFLDVPARNQFHSFVTTLVSNAITAGVGGGIYGVGPADAAPADGGLPPEGQHGLCYVPPPCTGTFADVPCPSTFATWIEALAVEGITGGCGGGNYCPTESGPPRPDGGVPAQGGARLVATRRPTAAGVFTDVRVPRRSPTGSSSSPPRRSPAAAGTATTAR